MADLRATKNDLVVFHGGGDIATALYGQGAVATHASQPSHRDKLEYRVMNHCIDKGIPMFGICRGAQLLCVGAGGELVQDVTGHHSSHTLVMKDGRTLFCNSIHHQMMRPRGINHEVLGWTPHKSAQYIVDTESTVPVIPENDFPEGEPEIVFFPDIKALGVQYHPEMSPDSVFADVAVELIRTRLLGEK
jgi:gamma-glutamyl-gamma-aminobutyrate hydrolase PuuD